MSVSNSGIQIAPWLQYVGALIIGLGLFFGAIVRGYRKGPDPKPKEGEAVVLSATLADSRAVDRLVIAIDRLHTAVEENSDCARDASRKHCECMNENTDAMINLLRFVRRREGEP